MQIVYDHQIFSTKGYGGISRYFYELASHLSPYPDCDVRVLAPVFVNNYLKDDNCIKITGRFASQVPKTGLFLKYINSRIVKILLDKDPPDILHETYYSTNKCSSVKTRTVATVYDMIHEKFPWYFPVFPVKDNTASLKSQAVQRADHIICISEQTKNDLMSILGVEASRISVVHLGHALKTSGLPSERPLIDAPYLLYVGQRVGYKNFERLLRAYASSRRLRTDFKLACFGGSHFTRDEIKEMMRLGLSRDAVLQLSGNDDVLANAYKHASAFVYPSLYEGFGIPPLEAMSHRCPVICSREGSLPEVAADAAEYFDPYDPENIAASVERVVYSVDKTKSLISLGLERVSHFSWERCAAQTHEVYSSLI